MKEYTCHSEGWEHIQIAVKTLKCTLKEPMPSYTKGLLCRNWFQVKHSEVIYAIGTRNISDSGINAIKEVLENTFFKLNFQSF